MIAFVGCRYGSDVAAVLDIHFLQSGDDHEHGMGEHTHGDADDHHKDGDNDCHHDHHCCCQHSSPLGTPSTVAVSLGPPLEAAYPSDHSRSQRISASLIFHPPNA
jgi:hypothetical protein